MEDERRNSIRTLTRVYYDYQEERIRLDGRLGLTKDGNTKKGAPKRDASLLIGLMSRRESVFGMESSLLKEIATEVHEHPLWKSFLSDVKGVGELIAAVIISEFDINKADTVSNLWSFTGLAPGKDRKTKGNKCPYNQFLRAKLCGVLGASFLKCKSPYSTYYYNMKNRLEGSEKITTERIKGGVKEVAWKDCILGHRHSAAIRYMIKMFLKDLYVAWRTVEGLSVRKPYEEEYLGKVHTA